MQHHPSFAMTLIYHPYEQSYDISHRKPTVTILFWLQCQTKLSWNSSVLYPNISALSWWPVNVRQWALPCWTDAFSTSTAPSLSTWAEIPFEFSLSTTAQVSRGPITRTQSPASPRSKRLCDLRQREETSPPFGKTRHSWGFDQL